MNLKVVFFNRSTYGRWFRKRTGPCYPRLPETTLGKLTKSRTIQRSAFRPISTKKAGNRYIFGASVWCKRKRPKEDEFLIASYDIVDGQQRIASCLLLSISLMFEIKKIDAQIEHNALAKDLSKWLKAHVDHIEQRIIDTVVGELKRASQPFSRLIHEEDTGKICKHI